MKAHFQISIDNIVHYINVIGIITTTIDPLSAGLIIISLGLIFVIS